MRNNPYLKDLCNLHKYCYIESIKIYPNFDNNLQDKSNNINFVMEDNIRNPMNKLSNYLLIDLNK